MKFISAVGGWRGAGLVLAGFMAFGEAWAEDGPSATPNAAPALESLKKQEIERKLDAIKLPAMEMKDAPLRQAIEEIRNAAVEGDAVEGSKGVNIVLKLAEEAAPAVTVSFPGGSLREAMNQVAAAAKLKVKVEFYAVAFVPPGEFTDELVTREYAEPGAFILSLKPGGDGRPPIKKVLQSEGLEFPPGSSAVLTGSGKLIIRNSEANLKAIEDLLARKEAGR